MIKTRLGLMEKKKNGIENEIERTQQNLGERIIIIIMIQQLSSDQINQ